jgi:hypothetical protein
MTRPPDPTLEPTMPDEPLDDDLPLRPRRRLLTPVTGVLAGVLLAGLGFIGGVEVQKHQGATTASAVAGVGARGLAGARSGAAGAGTGGGPAPTAGTVAGTSGSVIYVKDASGTTIRVRTTSASKVTRTASSTAEGIHPGDSVVVLGATAKSGTVTADTIIATAKGAASGGFRGGFYRAFGRPGG